MSFNKSVITKKSKTSKLQTKYIYLDKNDKIIRNKTTIKKLNSIGVPPGYNPVLLSTSKNSPIHAIGVDTKGRHQYIYNTRITEKNKKEKYENVLHLGKHITQIRNDCKNIIKQCSTKTCREWDNPKVEIAIIIYLIDHCGFRIGNMKYAETNKSYGSTTLQNKHIIQTPSNKEVEINFIGKKGIRNTSIITEPKMVKLLNLLKRERPKFIFTITGEDVSEFLKTYHLEITPKMFRTWNANYYFIEKIRDDIKNNSTSLTSFYDIKNYAPNDTEPIIKLRKLRIAYINECFDYISTKLHNTANISKQSYVNNIISKRFITHNTSFINKLRSSSYSKLSNDEILLKIMED